MNAGQDYQIIRGKDDAKPKALRINRIRSVTRNTTSAIIECEQQHGSEGKVVWGNENYI